MKDKIRVGIIGMGTIAKGRHVPFYTNETDEAEIVAVCEIDEKRLDYMCGEFSLDDVCRYTDFRKLLERDDIDAVDVCLHNNYHAQVSIEALRSGKHVYCEKPIAGCYADGRAMLDAADETGKKLHIQLNQLYI